METRAKDRSLAGPGRALTVVSSLARAARLEAENGHRHPLAPAAVRVERSHLRGEGARSDQTALTVWFGSGPALPGPSAQASGARFVARLALGVLAAAALGAMGAIAAQREADRLRNPSPVMRISD